MSDLLNVVSIVISYFVSWISSMSLSLVSNPVIQIVIGSLISFFIFKLIINLIISFFSKNKKTYSKEDFFDDDDIYQYEKDQWDRDSFL